MYAYKGFEPDLSCRGYRFVMGKNITPEANCASNGFHCAEDPLDCLTYYSDMDRSIYCLVQPGGDIDEDDRDSKIACTELTILRQLTRKEFFLHALAYMVDHPGRKVSGKVQREHSTSRNGYAIVRGKEPAACGKLGDIDGIVVTYNDAAYARSCGRTGHHYKDGLAFKFEDDTYETVLRSIEWTPSRTGEIAPVAIFDTVEIDGCAVSRASLHNLSFIENLELAPGCRIKVSKRNQIIPHVEENLDRNCYSRDKVVPARCPCCGQPTRIHMTKNTVNGVEKVTAALFCDNEHCETRKLRKFVHFASPKAMNIMGLSESILEKFIGKGWLHSYMDIFALDKHRAEIVQMEGFGEKSWQNLWDAIQHSRITTFEQYLTAMDIPMVGSTASKAICQRFRGNLAEFETAVCQSFDFTQLPDFGETLHRNIHQWFRSEENWTIWTELRRLVCIKTYQPPAASTDMSNPFVGKTLVVTGKVEPYTRDGINEKIESLGAHAGSSVSSKTDYLICGENAGSKLAKAQELGIKILSPDEFFRMAGESA